MACLLKAWHRRQLISDQDFQTLCLPVLPANAGIWKKVILTQAQVMLFFIGEYFTLKKWERKKKWEQIGSDATLTLFSWVGDWQSNDQDLPGSGEWLNLRSPGLRPALWLCLAGGVQLSLRPFLSIWEPCSSLHAPSSPPIFSLDQTPLHPFLWHPRQSPPAWAPCSLGYSKSCVPLSL